MKLRSRHNASRISSTATLAADTITSTAGAHKRREPKATLKVTCWCEREVVDATPADIGRITASCGRPECHQ
jgi:hypothetical protein